MNIETIIEGRMWIVRNMIPKELCKHVAMEYHMMKDVIKWQYPNACLLYTSPSPRDGLLSRMPSSA